MTELRREFDPTFPMNRAMAQGHRTRKGHDLVAHYVPNPQHPDLWFIVRTCCGEEDPQPSRKEDGDITTREEAEAVPVGTVGFDKDHYPIVKTGAETWAYLDGTGRWTAIDTGELMGEYGDGETPFLPITNVVEP